MYFVSGSVNLVFQSLYLVFGIVHLAFGMVYLVFVFSIWDGESLAGICHQNLWQWSSARGRWSQIPFLYTEPNFKVEEEAKSHGDILQVVNCYSIRISNSHCRVTLDFILISSSIWISSWTNHIAGWLWRIVPQACPQVHECFPLVRKVTFLSIVLI